MTHSSWIPFGFQAESGWNPNACGYGFRTEMADGPRDGQHGNGCASATLNQIATQPELSPNRARSDRLPIGKTRRIETRRGPVDNPDRQVSPYRTAFIPAGIQVESVWIPFLEEKRREEKEVLTL
jgi:hypothetical protein